MVLSVTKIRKKHTTGREGVFQGILPFYWPLWLE